MRSTGLVGSPVFLTVLIQMLALAVTGCSSGYGLLPRNNLMTPGLSRSQMRGDINTRFTREQERYFQSVDNQRRWYAQKWLETAQLPEPKRTYMRQKLLAIEKESIDELERTLQETERQGQTDSVNILTDSINTTVTPGRTANSISTGRTMPSVAPSF